MLMVSIQKLKSVPSLLKLWYHECCRVFEDRLVSNEDRSWFESLLQSKVTWFGAQSDKVLGTGPLLYADFINPNADPRVYEEITEVEKVIVQCVLSLMILHVV